MSYICQWLGALMRYVAAFLNLHRETLSDKQQRLERFDRALARKRALLDDLATRQQFWQSGDNPTERPR